jgi:transposase InsO family protein
MNSQTYERQIRHRLTILRHAEEISFNVASTCRHYGISRNTFYKWERRFKAEGPDGLAERSRAPKNSPNATSSEIVGKIIYLRQNYHFGPQKIAMYLARYHDLTISDLGVGRILKKFELNRLPSSQRYKRHDRKWKRYEKQLPGHQLQIDVKFVDAIPGSGRGKKFYQFTAIDDCTRLRVLRLYPHCDQKTAIQFYSYTASRMPFKIERVQTDNGSEFQTAFHLHLLDQGVEHHYIRPRTPRLNGKVERSHRIYAEEFYRLLDGVIIDDTNLFNDKLQEWEDYYNYHRPHGGLAGQTPYERLKEKTNSTNPDTVVNGCSQLHIEYIALPTLNLTDRILARPYLR